MYRCPSHKTLLTLTNAELVCEYGCKFPVTNNDAVTVADFNRAEEIEVTNNLNLYSGIEQNAIYKNFLDWLFKTFHTTDLDFRTSIFNNLNFSENCKVLITGCGNGDDIIAINNIYHKLNLSIHAQDISANMVNFTAERIKSAAIQHCTLSVSNACNLPYENEQFDIVYHMGGINCMTDMQQAINEMTRVAKNGGQIAFIDEGIAPWLRHTDYSKMMINNNKLWDLSAPIDKLPYCATNVQITWLLENCFYFVSFIKNNSFPHVNFDVEHIGKRGGSIRTRYFGQLEGVTDEAKSIIMTKASASGKSVMRWLNDLIINSKE